MSYTWSKGRLTSIRTSSTAKAIPTTPTKTYTFTYNGRGQRTQKKYTYFPGLVQTTDYLTSDIINYDYDLHGRLLKEVRTLKYSDSTTLTKTLVYLYEGDEPVGVIFTNSSGTETYYYNKNPLGDVISILDSSGNTVVKYNYDAYGNCTRGYTTNNDLADSNPIRYRSYYYDEDTGLYYLNARYYNPQWRRFISPDDTAYLDIESANGLNLYAYCGNDPINYVDPSGQWIETVFDLLSLGVSIVDVVINPLDPFAWAGLAGDALDLIPFVTGAGETIKGMRVVAKGVDAADDTLDTIRFVKAVDYAEDFADGGLDIARTLDKTSDGFTISNRLDGIQIHHSFMGNGRVIPGSRLRVDGLNDISKTIYELKPYNRANLRKGVKQILNYNVKLGGSHKMIIVFY